VPEPQAPYSPAEVKRGEDVLILEGVFSRAMEGVTGGVILAGFALALGATDLEIGLLAAIPFLAQLVHIPAVALLARFPDRRPLVVWASAAARILFLVMAALPLLDLGVPPVTALLVLLAAYALLATLGGAGWQVWVRELVPRERLGAYFGRRMAILSVVGLVTLLAAGQFVAFSQRRSDEGLPMGFMLLFAGGALLGFTSAAVLSRAPSRPLVLDKPRPFREAVSRPFRDANYRRVLVFLGAWGFAANVALPFFSVVLLRTMGYGLGVVTLLAALSQVANVAGLRLWAPLTDRFGNKPILGLSASVFLLGMLAWALLPKVAGAGVLVGAGLIHVLLGFALAGLDVASNGIVMKMAPNDDVPGYLASASVVKAVATGVAPLLGGLAATLLAGHAFTIRLGWAGPGTDHALATLAFGPHDFLFLASVVLGLYALHRLLGFREEGEMPPEEVMRAMRREVGQPSSIAGMRTFAHLASYVVEAAWRFEKAVGNIGRPPV
jgi:MFS family permease